MYYLAMVYLVPWSHYLTKSFCIVSKLPDGRIWTRRWGPLSASLSLAKLPPNKAPSHPSVDTHLQVLAHVSYFKSRNEFTGGEFHQNTVSPFCPAVHNMPMARYTFLDWGQCGIWLDSAHPSTSVHLIYLIYIYILCMFLPFLFLSLHVNEHRILCHQFNIFFSG